MSEGRRRRIATGIWWTTTHFLRGVAVGTTVGLSMVVATRVTPGPLAPPQAQGATAVGRDAGPTSPVPLVWVWKATMPAGLMVEAGDGALVGTTDGPNSRGTER